MNLFDIDVEIMKLFDEETGEVLNLEALEQLEMARDKKLRNIIALYKNIKAEADELKKAEADFKKRAASKNKTAEKLLRYMDNYMNGSPYECVEGRLSYRKSETTECIDEEAFLNWSGRFAYGRAELVPDKDTINEAISKGETIPGWTIVEHNRPSIK